MKIIALICALVMTVSAIQPAVETGAFEEARPVGEFFMFSTAFGRYIIRDDGMGEVTFGAKRRAFWLKRGMAGRIDRVYFHEYEGDLLVLYEVNDKTGYMARMNQQQRKIRWTTPVTGPCAVEGDVANCEASKINLTTGARVNPD
jgi:hypothetical protein